MNSRRPILIAGLGVFWCGASAELVAFDVLALEGEDLRKLPLSMRKTNLQRLLERRPDGIFLSDHELGEIGPELFRKICEFGFEGLVSKRADRPYEAGRCRHWIKVKNRSHHAFSRVKDSHRRTIIRK